MTINNRNMGVDPAPRVLLEPICRDGHLPSLGSEREYRGLLEDAGLCAERFDDLTKQARPTWAVTIRRAGARLLRDPGARRFVRDRGQTGRGDVLALLRIPVAFRTGALRYGLFVATRSGDGCAPGTVRGTWVG